MDTRAFLEAVLPPDGVYYAVLARDGRTGMAHKPCTSIAQLAAYALGLDKRDGEQVYFACGSYKEQFVLGMVNGEEKRKYRVPENCYQAKAFWADLDVGAAKAEAGKGYIDKKSAVLHLRKFCKATEFPEPMLVSSGSGVHAYWPLTEAISADDWRSMAVQFKACLKAFGVFADPSRTADFASILRPVGTHNKKNPDQPKEVKLMGPVPAPLRPEEFMAALSNVIANHDVEVELVLPALPSYMQGAAETNDDLTAHLDDVSLPNFEIDADLVAEHCAQVRFVKETGSGVYDHWRGVAGVLKFCRNGDELYHEWSQKSPAYSQGETQQKLDTWEAQPTSCEFFRNANPAGCEGCGMNGRFKGPLNLGRVEPEPEPAREEEVVINGEPTVITIPEEVGGCKWDGKHMCRYLKKDGVMEAHPFASVMFYPVTRIYQKEGGAMLRLRRHLNNGEVREFDIPSSTAAVGGATLLTYLGENEIMPTHNKDAAMHMTAYLREGINDLLRKNTEVSTFTSFGWNLDRTAFLLGNRLYRQDGTVQDVLLGGQAASQITPFIRKGSAAGWTAGVNALYAHPSAEVYQYTLAAGLGATIACFAEEEYRGIVLALTGSKTGRGKTTVCRTALYAFGDAGAMTAAGPKGATINARAGRLGAYKNIPALFDELTKMKATELSDMAYEISSGISRARERTSNSGVVAAEQHTWCTHTFVTANSSIGATLATGQANSHAEAVRTLEIRMDDYHVPMVGKLEAKAAIDAISSNVGTAGAEFVSWVVQNQMEVSTRMGKYAGIISKYAPVTDETAFRFYRNHAMVTLTAASIMIDIGLAAFDMNSLIRWTLKHLSSVCRESVAQNTISGEDAVAKMINDMHADIITTMEYRDGRAGVSTMPEIVQRPHNTPVGRAILGNAANTEHLAGRLYLSRQAVKQWCLENRVDVATIEEHFNADRLEIAVSNDRFVIGRGTNITTVQTRCYVLDLNKLNGIASIPHMSVVPMKESA